MSPYEKESTTFRHSTGVTVRRGEFLYSYTISSPETLWDAAGGLLRTSTRPTLNRLLLLRASV